MHDLWHVEQERGKKSSLYQAQRAQIVTLHRGSSKCTFRKLYMVAEKQMFSNRMKIKTKVLIFVCFNFLSFCFFFGICCCTGQRSNSTYFCRILQSLLVHSTSLMWWITARITTHNYSMRKLNKGILRVVANFLQMMVIIYVMLLVHLSLTLIFKLWTSLFILYLESWLLVSTVLSHIE